MIRKTIYYKHGKTGKNIPLGFIQQRIVGNRKEIHFKISIDRRTTIGGGYFNKISDLLFDMLNKYFVLDSGFRRRKNEKNKKKNNCKKKM